MPFQTITPARTPIQADPTVYQPPVEEKKSLFQKFSDSYKSYQGTVQSALGFVAPNLTRTVADIPKTFAGSAAMLPAEAKSLATGQPLERTPAYEWGEKQQMDSSLSAVPKEASAKAMAGQALGGLGEYMALKGVGGGTGSLAQKAWQGAKALAPASGLMSAGQAMQEDKSAGEVVTEGLVGAGIGGALGAATPLAAAVAQPVVKWSAKKLAPLLTGIGKKEIENAVTVFPEKVQGYMDTIRQAPSQEDAQMVIRSAVKDKGLAVHDAAKEVAEKTYGEALDTAKAVYGEARGDWKSIAGSFNAMLKRTRPGTREEDFAMKQLQGIIADAKTGKLDIDGLRVLKSDLGGVVESFEKGSNPRRLAKLITDAADDELNRITEGTLKPANQAYAKFKDLQDEIRPLWAARDESTKANFMANLLNAAKSEKLKALKELERLAGGSGDEISNEVSAMRIANKMSSVAGATKGRVQDIALSQVFSKISPTAIGAGIGGIVGGPFGGALGAGIGGMVTTAVLNPETIGKVLFPAAKEAGVQMLPGARKAITNLLSNPKTRQVLQGLLAEMESRAAAGAAGMGEE